MFRPGGKEAQPEPDTPSVTVWGQVVGLDRGVKKNAHILFEEGRGSARFPVKSIGYYGEPTPPVRVGYIVTASVAKDLTPGSELKLNDVKVAGLGGVVPPQKSAIHRLLHHKDY